MFKQFAIASLIGMAATAAVCASIKPPQVATAPTTVALVSGCLPYNQTITLPGKLSIVQHHFDGAVDVPTYYLLHLDRPICTLPGTDSDLDPAEAGVTEMQLWDFHAKAPVDRPVQVTGKMWHSFTLHHRTDVIFDEVSVK